MQGCRRKFLFAALFFLYFSGLYAQSRKEPVRFESHLSHTAVWVGVPFEYRITLDYPSDVEIIRDNLKKENLNLDPFTLLDLKTASRTAQDGTAELELTFTLTTLDSSGSEAVIPSLSIYYATRRRGSLGKGTELETHTLVVPARKIGLRSTLTSDSRNIRDAAKMDQPGSLVRRVGMVGWILLLIIIFQTTRWVVLEHRQRASSKHKRDRKFVEQQALSALNAIASNADGEGVPERYNRISQILRNTVKEVTEIEASVLTPKELRDELAKRNVGMSEVDQITRILEACDTARYAPQNSNDRGGDLQAALQDSQNAVSQLVRL